MDYRNERDALRGRVEGLEQELDEAKRQLSEARRREGEAQVSQAEAVRLARLEATMPQAEALIHRFRRELSVVKDMQAAHPPAAQATEKESSDAPVIEPARTSPGRSVAVPLVLATLVAWALLGVGFGIRHWAQHRHPDVRAVDAPPAATVASIEVVVPPSVVASQSAPVDAASCHVTLSLTAQGDHPSPFDEARRIAVDADGSAYVADKTGRIQRFDRDGKPTGAFLAETTSKPHGPLSTDIGLVEGLAVDHEGHVVVSVGYDVVFHDATTGRVLTKVPHTYPSTCFRDVTPARHGKLLVWSACTDSNRYEIVEMTTHGGVLATFPEGPIGSTTRPARWPSTRRATSTLRTCTRIRSTCSTRAGRRSRASAASAAPDRSSSTRCADSSSAR